MDVATFLRLIVAFGGLREEGRRMAKDSDALRPCPFCGAEVEVWQDGVRTWGLIEHSTSCWVAYGMPRCKQEIPHDEFAAWNRRTGDAE